MRIFSHVFYLLLLPCVLTAQTPDPGKDLNTWVGEQTGKKLQFEFEMRQRVEDRTGQLFGKDRDLTADFVRVRFGLIFKPKSWLKFSGMAQDTRAPFYGPGAPGVVRDPVDLQEGYVEIFSATQRGLGLNLGRQMVNYGDTRLIGSPNWAFTGRTWDTARLYHVSSRARLEAVFLSTVVRNGAGFNQPVLGDRIWGTYNTFKNVFGKHTAEVYLLRHDQNRPGGFTGVGTLGINLFGTRWVLALPSNFRFTTEAIAQTGHVGPQSHRAFGIANMLNYRTTVHNMPLDFANEYKYASGTDAASGRHGTFDQLYPAAHDKMGHADLFGWINVHNIRSTTTLTVRKGWTWSLMYNNSWLASATDGVYGTNSKLIARDLTGRSGRHIGQELDLFTNYNFGGFSVGAGVGQFFSGGFIQKTTPGANSHLLYLSTAYAF